LQHAKKKSTNKRLVCANLKTNSDDVARNARQRKYALRLRASTMKSGLVWEISKTPFRTALMRMSIAKNWRTSVWLARRLVAMRRMNVWFHYINS